MALSIGESAPDVELLDVDGRPVRLSSIWTQQPLVLFFIRHLG